MDKRVTADKVTPGLWEDSRPEPYLWLVNGQWDASDKELDVPFCIVLGGPGIAEWHYFRSYSREYFVGMHGPNYTFRKLM